jgi:RNA polymerase sigma factor (sigma-70 family)
VLVLSAPESSRPSRPIMVPVVPARGMIEPAIDHMLSELARNGDRTDPELRNALYIAYAPRLRRILLRLWYRNLNEFGCELEDLEQELFLIVVALLERWSGDGSLSAYLHGAVPWRLYDAARRLAPRDRSLDGRPVAVANGDDSHDAAEAALLLETLADRLGPFDQTMLLGLVRDGKSLGQIARSLGVSQRTARREWQRLQQQLRRELA